MAGGRLGTWEAFGASLAAIAASTAVVETTPITRYACLVATAGNTAPAVQEDLRILPGKAIKQVMAPNTVDAPKHVAGQVIKNAIVAKKSESANRH